MKIRIVLLVTGSLFALILLEITLRTMLGTGSALHDVRSNLYQYDAYFGWLPIPHSEGEYHGYRATQVKHNSDGFRDREHGNKQKPRIAIFGDSFVWGYDSQEEERFSNLLQLMMPEWDVLNFGVSGFGTDQEYLLAQKVIPEYQPEVVVLIFTGHNDFKDNSSNVQAVYMKPYFELGQANQLALQGVPVPKTWVYYFQSGPLRIFRKSKLVEDLGQLVTHSRIKQVPDPTFPLLHAFKLYVEAQGAQFLLGLVDNTPRVLKWCDEQAVDCVGLQTSEVYPSFGKHWNQAGNQFVAERLFSKLEQLTN